MKQVVGVLLAAGAGQRFDPFGQQDKLLAELGNGKLVVAAAANSLRSVLDDVIAVARPGNKALVGVLEGCGCRVTVCPEADHGMGAVVSWGLRHLLDWYPEARSCVIALGDMPFIRTNTVAQVVGGLMTHDLVAPTYQGRRGHPVGFRRLHFDFLAGLSGELGARALFDQEAGRWLPIPVDDSGVIRDIDVLADLSRSS